MQFNNIVSEIGSIRSESEATQSAKNDALFKSFEKELNYIPQKPFFYLLGIAVSFRQLRN